MWYVNKLFGQSQVESLAAKGFLVRSSGGVVRIEKYNCGAELRKTSGDSFQMTEIPCIMPVSYTHLDVYKRQCLQLSVLESFAEGLVF